jgi:hypothetical protein
MDDAEKAVEKWFDGEAARGGTYSLASRVMMLTSLLREREAAAWKAGAEAMREKARAQAMIYGGEPTGRMIANAVRALPIPEPMR